MSIVHMKEVDFSYGEGSEVLNGIDGSLPRNKVSVLMGPSGAGKTTLLRLVNLLEKPDSGRIELHFKQAPRGDSSEENLSLRRNMSFVFQEPALFDGSVKANVAYGPMVRRGLMNHFLQKATGFLSLRPRNGDSEGKEVESVLDMVDLGGFQNRSVRSLSAGEERRVTLARALITGPELLLLDEPTTNLDPSNTSIVEDIITRAAARGTSVFLATHDMNQAERIASEVFLLLGGTIIESGRAEKIFTEPEKEKTGEFVSGKLVY